MVLPKRPCTESGYIKLPKIISSSSRVSRTFASKPRRPPSLTALPPIERTSRITGKVEFPAFYHSSNGSDKPLTPSPYLTTLPRINPLQSSNIRCTNPTAGANRPGTPTQRRPPSPSLYDRLSRLNLTGVGSGIRQNGRNIDDSYGGYRFTRVKSSTQARPSTSIPLKYFDLNPTYPPGSYNQLRQSSSVNSMNNYNNNNRPLTPSDFNRRFNHESCSCKKFPTINSSFSSCNSYSTGTTVVTCRPASATKGSILRCLTPTGSVQRDLQVQAPKRTSNIIRSISSNKENKNSNRNLERLLSSFTTMDPYHEDGEEKVSTASSTDLDSKRKTDKEVHSSSDENNCLSIDYLIPPDLQLKHVDSRVVTANRQRKFQDEFGRPAGRRKNRRDQNNNSFSRVHGVRFVDEPVNNNNNKEVEKGKKNVKDLSSKIYEKLKNVGIPQNVSRKESKRDETLMRLKKAFAILQDELDELNIDEEKVAAARGLDYREFELKQRRDLERVRNSVQPYRKIVKELKQRASDVRHRVPMAVPDFHELIKTPQMDKSRLPRMFTLNVDKVGAVSGGIRQSQKVKVSSTSKLQREDIMDILMISPEENQNQGIGATLSSSLARARPLKRPTSTSAVLDGRKRSVVQSIMKSKDKRI